MTLVAVTAAVAVARRRQDSGKRAVSVQAEQKRRDDRQAATAEHVRAEDPVFRAEYEQCDKDPKGNVTR